jgi:hypothetical protein
MTKTYEECCKEVGLDIAKIEPPVQTKNWFAYVDGKAIKCESQAEAKKYKLHEMVLDPVSRQAIISFWDSRRALEEKALAIFRESLRENYPEMSTAMFDLCYIAAQERSRSADHDEIPDHFKYFVDFAKTAIKLKK